MGGRGRVRRVAVVTSVPHVEHAGRLYAYTPYARELGVWAGLFDEIVVVAPRRSGPPTPDQMAVDATNVRLDALPDPAVHPRGVRVGQLVALPTVKLRLLRVARRVDAVHIRCPSDVGLLATLLGPFLGRRRHAKYATSWSSYRGEPSTYRLQRRLLQSRWWGAPVSVYGRVCGDPPWVVDAFSTALDDEQLAQAVQVVADRTGPHEPLRLLSVGRLTPAKHVDAALRLLAGLDHRGIAAELTVVGDGPEREALEALADELGLSGSVRFAGALPLEEVLERYAAHDVLVQLSQVEGWPKAVAEAMAYGLVCVACARGAAPAMLGSDRGITVDPGDHRAAADALALLVDEPERFASTGRGASSWAARLSRERFRVELAATLAGAWRDPTIGARPGHRHGWDGGP